MFLRAPTDDHQNNPKENKSCCRCDNEHNVKKVTDIFMGSLTGTNWYRAVENYEEAPRKPDQKEDQRQPEWEKEFGSYPEFRKKKSFFKISTKEIIDNSLTMASNLPLLVPP